MVYSESPDSTVLADKYDYAVVVVGEPPYAETQGDNLNLTIPAPGPSVIQSVCKATKCVVVLISGRPLVVEPYLGDMDAFVAAWLPGTEGQGVADVLFGDYGFTGEAAADVVQVGGPAAHERGRRALRPALPVRLRAHHQGREMSVICGP